MRVAVIASYAPSLVNFRGPLLRALVAGGHDVIALAPEIDPATRAALAAIGVTAREIPLRRAGTNPVQDLRTLSALVRTLRAVRPDVVFSYTVKPVVYGSLAARLAGVPRVVAMVTGLGHAFIESDDRRAHVALVVRSLYRAGLRCCHRVIFHNPDDLRLFVDDGLVPDDGRAVVVGGSGVDTARFAATPLPDDGAPVFLLIARLLGEKGVREYVEAARRVRRNHPECRFRLVGPLDSNPSAISRQELDGWIADGSIEYGGAVADVRPELARCHVYVLPSWREGMPRTNLEAMAMARPLITTDVPGCRHTVEPDGNGVLVPARDAAALAAGVEAMLARRDTWPRLGARSRQLVEQRYGVEAVNRAMLEHITGQTP